MEEKGRSVIAAAFVIAMVLVFFVVALVSKHNRSQSRQPKKEFGKIYRADDGRYYTRSHDRNGFSDWEYTAGGDAAGGETSGSLSTGTWFRVSSTPSGMSPTSKVVAEENGKPVGAVEEESAVGNNEEITESTTESEADSMDSASDSDSGGDSGSSDGGGDGGGGSD
ncbi:MAG: hypothetical protein ABR924_13600 [Terracidiphilus sp.]|jgi:hypothetical protein